MDLVALPERGRRFTGARTVRLGDVDPTGRLRLDAVARALQDVAADDAADAGLVTGWVVRRTLVDVRAPGRLGERLELTTWCSGTGRSWAERRTTVAGDGGAAVEAVSLWVQVDPRSGRPTALTAGFEAGYGEAAGGRRVSTRLRLPSSDDGVDVERRPWLVRAVDLDPFGHVNNAAHWAIVEEVLAPGDGTGTGELEHVLPVDGGDAVELRARHASAGDVDAWLVDDGGRVRTAARWRPAVR